MKSLSLLLISVFIFSCLKENKIVLKNDLETHVEGWSEVNLLHDSARSGKTYTYVDAQNAYSTGFSKKLSEISDHKIKRIDAICWIRKKEISSMAFLVISLDRGDKPVFWQTGFSDDTNAFVGEWTRFYVSYDLPDSVGKDETLRIYLWNKGTSPLFADDFEFRLFY